MAAVGELERLARRLRRHIVTMSHRGRAPHLGSALSCADIVAVAYFDALRIDAGRPLDPDRDRFLLSKGHAAMAQYAALAERGFLDFGELERFNTDGARLAEHPPANRVTGVEAATGSLGHGLPIGAGMALAARLQQRRFRVFVVMSDGECNEGSVWEAAMFAAARGLENLIAIVDYNRWQATGRSDEVLALAPLAQKFAAFGWSACEVDGHDHAALRDALRRVPDGSGRPVAVVAHTVKGKGVSFMEDDNNWHYRVPNAGEYAAAMAELADEPGAPGAA